MHKIEALKKEKDAVILAHYYVDGEIQRLADYVGDSFYLAQTAKKLEHKVIVMAGVYFMAESVKILNPDKKVLLPDMEADCPMAHMVTVEKINEVRETYEDVTVVTYINSSAKIKAYSDICVTSSNAVNIVKKLKNKNIFFVPDKNLGSYVANQVPEKNIILNDGYCPVHNKIEQNSILTLKRNHPNAKIMVHPECVKEVVETADYIGSTKGIIEEVGKMPEKEYIIVTEDGILAELKRLYPDKDFYIPDNFICKDMKLLTVEKLESVLKHLDNEIKVEEEIAKKALVPLNRMLELGA